ncbi:DUF3630 family protein [Microvirga sp. STS02]|uniref:DUF3630 family protein n=1 Tax=Hymenobacter negativus TaxID=2795026 RepID=UPI0018DB382C|nr:MULTISPECIES: DUF3630 family protein [Bacteria]MBH8568161.1 DUF3630 family protein [Hymenobacter negativus]MBR7207896.1 DUF3630 family protein [Microvirga sp. STS02]
MTRIEDSNGYAEFIIAENCGFKLFYDVAARLERLLGVEFTNKVDDFDALYWCFNYQKSRLILHYSIYSGISIYPENSKGANRAENESVDSIAHYWLAKEPLL